MLLGRPRYWVCFVLPVVLGWIIAPALGLIALSLVVLATAASHARRWSGSA